MIKKLQALLIIGVLLLTFATNIVEPLQDDDPDPMTVELTE